MIIVLVKCVIILILSIVSCQGKVGKLIEVKATGLLPVEPEDVGFGAYVTVQNIGGSLLHVVCKMVECCESLSDDDTDCTFMQLMGGNMGFMYPNVTRNITLLFPNLYPYNRKGDCLIAIWYKDRYNITGEVQTSLPFNTYAKSGSSTMDNSKERALLMINCDGPDLDPLDECRPVDCHQKYNGEKTYFSRIRNRCIQSPACYSDPNKIMPDVAYLPVSNMCRDLENPITEDDVRYLTKVGTHGGENSNEEDSNVKWSELNLNLRCHHGRMNNKSGLCRCDDGWTSPTIKDNLMISSTLLFHMCTIKKRCSKLINFGFAFNRIYERCIKLLILASAMNILAALLLCMCFPSLDDSCAVFHEDMHNSETTERDSDEYCDSDCCSITDKESCADSKTSVDTYFILLDKAGYNLYTDTIDNAVYEEVVEEIVSDFQSPSSVKMPAIYDISSDSTSSCSNLLIESDRSSVDDNIDTDILPSNESDWELDDIVNTSFNINDESLLLNDYINKDIYKRDPIRKSMTVSHPPRIEESSDLLDINKRNRNPNEFGEQRLSTSTMRHQLSKELDSILNSPTN